MFSKIACLMSDGDSDLDELEEAWLVGKARGNEVDVNTLPKEEQAEFDQARLKEWNSIHASGAIKILSQQESDYVRRFLGSRMMKGRFVQTKKFWIRQSPMVALGKQKRDM